jgi:hypothetical protein
MHVSSQAVAEEPAVAAAPGELVVRVGLVELAAQVAREAPVGLAVPAVELELSPVEAPELAQAVGQLALDQAVELELSPAEALELDRVAVELAHALAAVAPVRNRSVIAAHHHAQVPVPKRAADLVAAVGGITRDPAAIGAAVAWVAAE